MKKLLLLTSLLFLAGCDLLRTDQTMTIANDCRGVWFEIYDGRGNVLQDRIDFGQVKKVDLNSRRGSTVELLAVGHDAGTNVKVGAAQQAVYVPYTSNNPTGPTQQIRPWDIHCSDMR
ncbi:MAG: hypothetical protein WAX80_01205 [Minisyncoccia bacterium]